MINITIVAHLCIWTYIHVYIPCTCISRSGPTRDRLSAYFFSQRTYIVLKTFKLTPNCMLYEDTGSIDMTTQVHKKMVNFWLKNKIQFRWEISLCFMPISFKLKFRGTRTPQFQVVQKNEEYSKLHWFFRCLVCPKHGPRIFQDNFCPTLPWYFHAEMVWRYVGKQSVLHLVPPEWWKYYLPLRPTGEVGDKPHYLFKCVFFEKDRKKSITQSLLELPIDIAIHILFDSGKESLIKTAKFAKIIMSKF